MQDRILVSGGAGFIGSNFIRMLLSDADVFVLNIDALTYAGNLENLSDVCNKENYVFAHKNILQKDEILFLCKKYEINGIINFAAESHVDRSIHSAAPFIDTNISGTLSLLEVAKELKIRRFLQISTDEVYGSLGPEGKFTEDTPLDPKSPYSASKAAADHFVMSYVNTFGLPALITRCSNNYGPYQFPEKLIPLMILNALEDKQLPVYGDGMNVRDWIHVQDHCEAVWSVYRKGKIGEVYNIGGNCEKTNIDIVRTVLSILGKPESLIKFVQDRPGHDRRYAMDIAKIKNELGWSPRIKFTEGINETVKWYVDNSKWCANVRSGVYLDYYKKQYGTKE